MSSVAQRLGIDVSAATRRCQTAQKRGYIRNEETSRGRPARYVLDDPLPEEQTLLPPPELLSPSSAEPVERADACTTAVQIEEPPPVPPLVAGARRRIVL